MKLTEEAEDAKALYDTYFKIGRDFTRGVSMHEFSKVCAIQAVDFIIEADTQFYYGDYWETVKDEIRKL